MVPTRRQASPNCYREPIPARPTTVEPVAEVIPVFPLSHVLLPGMPLPLHVFEQRYRDLLDDIAEAPGGPCFGVVALRSGAEARTRSTVDEGPDVEEIGTLAEILELEPRDDGTSDLLSVGSRRFRIARLVVQGKPYLRAEVEFLAEDDGDLSADLAPRARELLELYDAILIRLAGRATGSELPDDPNQLSYQVAPRLPLPPAERQELLVATTTAARLDRLAGLLRREIALLRCSRSIAVSPAVLRVFTGINDRVQQPIPHRVVPAQVVADGEGREEPVNEDRDRRLDEHQAVHVQRQRQVRDGRPGLPVVGAAAGQIADPPGERGADQAAD